MNEYQEQYNELILTAVERNWTKQTAPCYTERHHILPRCQGGSDESSNLVELTAQEHYHAHRLLAMVNPEEGKLQQAWWMMCHTKSNPKNSGRVYEITAEEYEEASLRNAEITRKRFTGIKLQKEHVEKISGENNHQYGRVYTYEERMLLSDKQKGRKQETIKCPHCPKSGGVQSMKRWHFDNCKWKGVEYIEQPTIDERRAKARAEKQKQADFEKEMRLVVKESKALYRAMDSSIRKDEYQRRLHAERLMWTTEIGKSIKLELSMIEIDRANGEDVSERRSLVLKKQKRAIADILYSSSRMYMPAL